MTANALSAVNVVAGYGHTKIVNGVSFDLAAGDALAVLGRNGVGKTTLLGALAGRVNVSSGQILLRGKEVQNAKAYRRVSKGLTLVPQEREIFATLTVEENLRIAASNAGSPGIDTAYELFPRLKERRANKGSALSGGEQQMLSIARALLTNPSVLLLDEPFEGLAPVIVEQLTEALQMLRKTKSITMVLVEQHADLAVEIAGNGLVLERGQIALSGDADSLRENWHDVEKLLSVA
ncbi:ABC transporter ATP-binding protein [Roseibium sp. SCP14]|uniref:ABC transporter ATP-binding protein n=1 Tax=Roseibium sp. SCP14 TaxID=3141375 RepID=UPI003337F268